MSAALERWAWLTRILRGEVLRAGALASAVQAAGLLLVFFLQLLLARVMVDQQSYGQYVWGQNLLFLLGGITALGLPVIAGRQVALHAAQGNLEAQRSVLRRAVALILLAYAAMLLFAAILIWRFPLPTALPLQVIALSLLGAPFAGLALLMQSVLRSRGRLLWAFLPYQVLRPLLTAAVVLAVLLISRHPLNAQAVLAAVGFSLAVVLAVQWLIDRRPLATVSGVPAQSPTPPLPALKLLRETLPAFAASLCTLVMTYSNVLAVGVLAGPAAAGAFFVAERLAQLATTPATVASAVVQPWLARAHAARDRARLQAVVTQAAHIGLWPTLLVVGGLWWFAKPMLGLFGAHFQDAVPVLGTLLLAQALGVSQGPAQATLIMSGHQALVMRMAAFAAFVHLLLLVILVPLWGAMGAAVATLTSTLLDAMGCMLLARSRLELRLTVLGSLSR